MPVLKTGDSQTFAKGCRGIPESRGKARRGSQAKRCVCVCVCVCVRARARFLSKHGMCSRDCGEEWKVHVVT